MTHPTPIPRVGAGTNTDTYNPLLVEALHAAGNNWPVFPLIPGDKRPALHGEERCPRTGACVDGHVKWENRATTDPIRIGQCWQTGAFNIGIATGPAGLLVVDLDVPKDKSMKGMPDGMTTFKALCERAGEPLPTTHTVRTPSGGRHLYFHPPCKTRLGNTAGKLAPLIDTRGWGGYVLAPGSTTEQGTYEIVEHAPVAPMPKWLTAALTPRRPCTPVMVPAPRNASAYATAALRNEVANVANAPEGTRNRTLVRAARALGRLVKTGDLTRSEVEQALNQGGQACGLGERECMAAITHALNWSIANNPGLAS
ncbi:bifunctional DNA primase/polymerase [Streptomyces sp. SCA3-4]|uniref:bifunctional DNA primase/polymerase n=1 Tax=Streptomyces sichuanensis TaxID=2871810 RepID=UPI001CE2721F|nr:bifunctional DNA primase/polymerase [Streptomyces sichuanensis]MCA6094012.1 bifunctional DNA primase/polymerase [Streptomyces sichuanensis]